MNWWQQQLEYTLLKPDFHRWWISKMQYGCEDTLEERYAIKLCFKLGKNATERMKCFRLLSFLVAWEIQESRESVRDDERCGRSKEVNTPELIGHRLGLGLLCWGFKGVHEDFPREKASTLQIGSVAFPPGQCTSLQLHPCHRLFDQDGHQDSSLVSL